MAALDVSCPKCKVVLRLNDVTPGSRFRCPRCYVPFSAPASPAVAAPAQPAPVAKPPLSPTATTAAPPTHVPTARPQPVARPAVQVTAQPRLPSWVEAAAAEKKVNPPERKVDPPPSRGSRGKLYGFIGGGAALIALVCFIIVKANQGGDDDANSKDRDGTSNLDKIVASKDDLPASRDITPPAPPSQDKPVAKDDRQPNRDGVPPPPPDQGKLPVAPEKKPEQDKGPKPEQDKAPNKDSTSEPRPNPNPPPATETGLPRDVLQKVKLATVYIRVRTADGRMGSGSGFWEKKSGMVMTNAHVLGMLRKGAGPPSKIDVVMSSGMANEFTVQGQVAGVDSTSDLALLKVDLPAEKLAATPMLDVLSADDLIETQKVYTFGYPFGERVNKNVTVSSSEISSLHRRAGGTVEKVQVNGGIHPGNSGGPVVDQRGNVIGVAVSYIEGSTISFAIPGNFVSNLLDGRLSSISVRNEPVAQQGGKYAVSVKVFTLDPLKKMQKLQLDYWIGPAQATVPPSDTRPAQGEGATARLTADVTYDSQAQSGQATLTLDSIPSGGRRLWVQPVITNGSGKTRWVAGGSYEIAVPPDPRPTTLAAQFRTGKQTVHLKSTAKLTLQSASGDESLSYTQNIDTQLSENIIQAMPEATRVRLTIEKFSVGVNVNGQAPDTSPEFKRAIQRDVGFLDLTLVYNSQGSVFQRSIDVGRVPPASREILRAIGEQLQQSLETASIPLPGGQVTPGQSWKAQRNLPVLGPDRFSAAAMEVTYTYRGLRNIGGKDVAVLDLRGAFIRAAGGAESLKGVVTGEAHVDPETGTVLLARTHAEVTINTTYRRTKFEAKGTLESRLERGTP